jgi:hypothetical protein
VAAISRPPAIEADAAYPAMHRLMVVLVSLDIPAGSRSPLEQDWRNCESFAIECD